MAALIIVSGYTSINAVVKAELFPTFALIAHYIVGKGRSVDDLKTTIVFGMWSIIPYFVYLAANCRERCRLWCVARRACPC